MVCCAVHITSTIPVQIIMKFIRWKATKHPKLSISKFHTRKYKGKKTDYGVIQYQTFA